MEDDIAYFLTEEKTYNQKNLPKLFDFDFEEFDPLEFLGSFPFENEYKNLLSNQVEVFRDNPFSLSLSEKLIFLLLIGEYSFHFRNDYNQPLLKKMKNILEGLLDKLNPCINNKVYRYCKDHDKLDFFIGEEWLCPFSLTCRTTEDWELHDGENMYEIILLPREQTRARNVYEVHNHGEECDAPENQVNFKKDTRFSVVDIIEMQNNGKKIVLAEMI